MIRKSGSLKVGPLAIIFLAVTAAVFVVACGEDATPTATIAPTPVPTPTVTLAPTPTATSTHFPLTIIDSNGNQVILEGPPERIVAIDSATVETLFALGEGDRVVGTHDFANYPPETADIEKVGSAFALDYERIAVLEPDLIHIFFGLPVPDLENLGTTVLHMDSPSTLQGVAEHIRMWGEIVDKSSVGEELAQEFEVSIDEAKERVASITEGPRVFLLRDPTLWTSGTGTIMQEILTILKAENIFEDVEDFVQVSPEEIVARDPEVIIGIYSVGPEPSEVMGDSPAFRGISAVQAGRIYRGNTDLLESVGPRLAQGIEQVAQFLYPELFP